MFELVAPRVLERLALFSATEHRPGGDAVTVEGEVGNLFYVIVSGELVVTHGREEIRRLGPGDWFGELALLQTHAHRTATVTAVGPVDLLSLDRETFLTALLGAPRSQAVAAEYAREHYR